MPLRCIKSGTPRIQWLTSSLGAAIELTRCLFLATQLKEHPSACGASIVAQNCNLLYRGCIAELQSAAVPQPPNASLVRARSRLQICATSLARLLTANSRFIQVDLPLEAVH